MKSFKKIAVIGKYSSIEGSSDVREQLNILISHLQQKGFDLVLENKTQQQFKFDNMPSMSLKEIRTEVDLAIVIGGDGTMLGVARSIFDTGIPLIGINQGRFGFLADLNIDSMISHVDLILNGNFIEDKRMLLQANIMRDDKNIYDSFALNDVVIKSGIRLIELEIFINNAFVHRQRSDGVIVSTPTGATAYALSAGGPILHPQLNAMSIVPINPHTLSNRPIAVDGESLIEIKIIHLDEAYVNIDGQIKFPLDLRDIISVKKSNQSISILHPKDYCYFEMLRNKLNWG